MFLKPRKTDWFHDLDSRKQTTKLREKLREKLHAKTKLIWKKKFFF